MFDDEAEFDFDEDLVLDAQRLRMYNRIIITNIILKQRFDFFPFISSKFGCSVRVCQQNLTTTKPAHLLKTGFHENS